MTWFDQFKNVFVIAEIGINHNGKKEEALKLIEEAAAAGADAVKVQVRDLEALYTRKILEDPLLAEHGTQYLLNELRRVNLDWDDLRALRLWAEDQGILYFGTPFDSKSVEFLEEEGVPLFKVGSPDLTNLLLIDEIVKVGRPILLSTGMATEDEIQQVIEFLEDAGADYAMLHCNSTYPASIGDINLRYMDRLAELTDRVTGYSGHERGFIPTLAAVARGARIIERHLTLDRAAEGADHSSSLEPAEFAEMVGKIRELESSLGGGPRVFNQGEQVNRIALGKSLVAAKDIPAGKVLTRDDLASKTPARGISPLRFQDLIGKTVVEEVTADDYFKWEDFEVDSASSRGGYEINRQWGIVGRLNDFEDFLAWKPEMIEIHLTWRDLVDFDPEAVAERYSSYGQDLVVHAPEYYQDELIDFTTRETAVLDYSLEMLKKTVELTRALAPRFSGITNERGPRIVVHPGGHFETRKETNRTDQYRALKDNLANVDSEGTDLLVENMPPLPWYFGGQWFQSVFLDPKEIRQFAEMSGLGVCYDTSHALLSCNALGIGLDDFTREVASLTRHLHIADGAGTTQEGLQLGDGELDFEHLFEVFSSIDTGFVTEIWQGHLNSGEGFHNALQQIESLVKGKLATAASCESH
ncbi:MAG: hypothetical protein CMO55_20230 [Verrucomicrobiales bacterium]|nr:hypothetical protein [Verrucomicrobiales bacterium]